MSWTSPAAPEPNQVWTAVGPLACGFVFCLATGEPWRGVAGKRLVVTVAADAAGMRAIPMDERGGRL